MGIVCDSDARRILADALREENPNLTLKDARRKAARLVDRIYGVDDPGARSFPPVPRVHSHRQREDDR